MKDQRLKGELKRRMEKMKGIEKKKKESKKDNRKKQSNSFPPLSEMGDFTPFEFYGVSGVVRKELLREVYLLHSPLIQEVVRGESLTPSPFICTGLGIRRF